MCDHSPAGLDFNKTDIPQIEEVQGVTQIMDQEEEIAIREFEKFEEKLRKVKEHDPLASPGKDGLGTAPA